MIQTWSASTVQLVADGEIVNFSSLPTLFEFLMLRSESAIAQ